jgi:hypothetical protein
LVNRLKRLTLTLDRLYRFFGLPFWVNLFWRDVLRGGISIDHRLFCWPAIARARKKPVRNFSKSESGKKLWISFNRKAGSVEEFMKEYY